MLSIIEQFLGVKSNTVIHHRNAIVCIRFIRNDRIDADLSANLSICNEINPETYCVESPDGISPASGKSRSFMRYADTGISAGICHEGNGYRTVCLGFPIETLDSEEDIDRIIRLTLEFFSR